MPRTVTETDARVLVQMRAELARLSNKIDNLRGPPGTRNTRDTLVIGSTQQAAPPLATPQPERIIRVRLTQTGGSAGTSSAVCSFTYSTFAWSDVAKASAIATDVPVLGRSQRIVAATMNAATYGFAVYDTDGTLKLLWCDETYAQSNCAASFAEPARAFATASSQEAGGITGTIFGDSLVTLSSPNSNTVQISTANTSKSGSGSEGTAIVRVLTAGASGGSLFRIEAKATGSTNKGAIRIFRQAAGTGTKFYIGQIDVPETTDNGIVDTWQGAWTPTDSQNGFILDSGDKIWVTTHVANTFNITALGADV